jgi:integrase
MPRKRREPWLDTRGDQYYAFWYDTGKARTERLSLRTTDREEARRRFAAFLIDGAEIRDTPKAGLTAGKALDDYFEEHVRKKVVDQVRQEDAIANLKSYFDATPLPEIDIPMSRAYADARRAGLIGGGKGRSPRPGSDSTIRRELNVLVAATNHAVRWKRLSRADMPSIELTQEERNEGAEYLTKAQLAKLLTGTDGRLHDFIQIAYYTASRRDAVEKLTWFQVDLAQRRIALAKAGERRTKKRRPVVPIDPALAPVLARLWETRTNEYVLGSITALYRPFVKACTRILGIDGHPHLLRHSRATHLLQDGASIFAVSKLLGDTMATVERVYGHHSVDYLNEVLTTEAEEMLE